MFTFCVLKYRLMVQLSCKDFVSLRVNATVHEEVCVSHGVRYRVGDTWNKQHKQGYMMRCTCLGNGRGAWRCQAYSEILGERQCSIDGL